MSMVCMQYRTVHAFIAHCVCTQLLTISSMIMHRHCFSKNWYDTHATSMSSVLASVTSPFVKREPFVGIRSRRPVEDMGEMRLLPDPSDHWSLFNRVQTLTYQYSKPIVLSQVLSCELTFPCMHALRIWTLENKTTGCSVALTWAQLHSLELASTRLPIVHHEASQAILGVDRPTSYPLVSLSPFPL